MTRVALLPPLVLAGICGSMPAGLARPQAAAGAQPGFFTGGANTAAADADIGPLAAQLTHLAGQGCPCAGSNGKVLRSRVGPVNIPGLLSVAATKAQSVSQRGASDSSNQQRAVLTRLSLLGGLVTAKAIRAQAASDATPAALSTTSKGSHLVALTIAGQKVPDNTPPNTQLPVPGLGTATVYEVTNSGDGTNSTGIQVHMLDIAIGQKNSFNLPVGAHITVGNASAGYNREAIQHVVGGDAYIATASLDLLNLLPDFGNLGDIAIGACDGTGGSTKTNTFAGVNEAGLISLGAGKTTAYGDATKNGKTGIAQTTAEIANVALLAGLIGADGIKAEATETVQGHKVTQSTAGTTFANLVVAGVPIPANPPPNTSIPLPLLGTLVVNEQIAGNSAKNEPLQVNALHLTVTSTNTFGLPVGAEVIIGHAQALARPLD